MARRKKKLGKPANQKVRNATRVVVDGVKFRSKLEAFTYERLKEAGIDFLYEEVKFNLVPPFEYTRDSYESKKPKGSKTKELVPVTKKIRAMTYLPDFVDPHKQWIIEVKGFENDVFPVKWKLFKYVIRNEPYTLYKPSNQKQVLEVVELIIKNHKNENNS